MKFILIMSPKGLLPNIKQLETLKSHGQVEMITHHGKLSDLAQLKTDLSEKVLAVDPVAFDWDMDGESVKDIPNVKYVCTQSTSYDWVKPNELKKLGVSVLNCAGFSGDSVAEFAIGMSIDLARHLPLYIKNGWKMDWDAPKPMLLKGKTLGVIGLGRIGTRIAEIGQGIGMNVKYWSKNTKNEKFEYLDLIDIFTSSDVIIPALAENESSMQIITNDLIASCKKDTLLIGINRIKSLWDEAYILQLVSEGKLGGYAFEGDNSKDIASYEGNVLPLPPMAWYTQDSRDALLSTWVSNIISTTTSSPDNIVSQFN